MITGKSLQEPLRMSMFCIEFWHIESALNQYVQTHNTGHKSFAAFHIQQVIEKMLKIQIYAAGVSYDTRKVWIHNIFNLLQYMEYLQINPIYCPRYIRENAKMITSWA